MQELRETIDPNAIPAVEGSKEVNQTVSVDSPFIQSSRSEGNEGSEQNDQSGEQAGDNDGGKDEPKKFEAPEVLKELFGEDLGEEDNVETLKEKLKTYKQRATEYETLSRSASEVEEIKQKVKSPWANETVRALNSFIATTGINDLSIASKFAGKKADEIVKNPVEALALRQVMSNPDVLKMATMDEVREAIASQYGVSEDVEINDAPIALKIAVGDAAKEIEGKLSASGAGEDIFEKLVGERTQREQTYQQYLSTITPKVGEIVSAVSELKIGTKSGTSFSLQVSDNVKSQLESEMRSYVASQGIDVTPEIAEQLKTAAIQRAKEIMVDDIAEMVEKQTKGVALKEAMKEVENGKPVDRNGAQVQRAAKSEDDWANKWLASKGRK